LMFGHSQEPQNSLGYGVNYRKVVLAEATNPLAWKFHQIR
jgi:hypothetical protein